MSPLELPYKCPMHFFIRHDARRYLDRCSPSSGRPRQRGRHSQGRPQSPRRRRSISTRPPTSAPLSSCSRGRASQSPQPDRPDARSTQRPPPATTQRSAGPGFHPGSGSTTYATPPQRSGWRRGSPSTSSSSSLATRTSRPPSTSTATPIKLPTERPPHGSSRGGARTLWRSPRYRAWYREAA